MHTECHVLFLSQLINSLQGQITVVVVVTQYHAALEMYVTLTDNEAEHPSVHAERLFTLCACTGTYFIHVTFTRDALKTGMHKVLEKEICRCCFYQNGAVLSHVSLPFRHLT